MFDFQQQDDVKRGKSCDFITFRVNMALICISYTLSPVKRGWASERGREREWAIETDRQKLSTPFSDGDIQCSLQNHSSKATNNQLTFNQAYNTDSQVTNQIDIKRFRLLPPPDISGWCERVVLDRPRFHFPMVFPPIPLEREKCLHASISRLKAEREQPYS